MLPVLKFLTIAVFFYFAHEVFSLRLFDMRHTSDQGVALLSSCHKLVRYYQQVPVTIP